MGHKNKSLVINTDLSDVKHVRLQWRKKQMLQFKIELRKYPSLNNETNLILKTTSFVSQNGSIHYNVSIKFIIKAIAALVVEQPCF